MIRAVVFDMDGLMFNTEDVYTAVGAELLRRRGLEFTAALKNEMMGRRPQPAFEALIRCCSLTDTWQSLAAESNQLFIRMLDAALAPMPGLFDLLDALECAEIPKAIGTSSCRELVDACLCPFKLADRFQFILTAEDIVEGKPHPEIYLTAACRFGISPAEMAVLEDSEAGCLAAVAAGAFAVAVPAAHSRDHDFNSASLVVDSLADPRLYDALGIGALRPSRRVGPSAGSEVAE
ncbi:MAG: HAD family phosphatase [Planctomycetaceae bacterium]|nr:HAD family phosphatase [Planctomycetaceae bacterium]